MKTGKSKYPNTYYRVSIKAIIRNERGEVLVARENPEIWNLVGGGMDHGETPLGALTREIYEEACIDSPFEATIEGVDSRYLESLHAYYMWVVYSLRFDSGVPVYGVGAD
ncbi:NUDIX domain-containing protein, partial [Candidatus Saccharibacteria bacterium]|nr:NUDIX domain-containing protein [Candidatus Saccharibacteria bacterium]